MTVSVGDKTATYVVIISELVTAAENETIAITNIPLTITIPEDTTNAGIQISQDTAPAIDKS